MGVLRINFIINFFGIQSNLIVKNRHWSFLVPTYAFLENNWVQQYPNDFVCIFFSICICADKTLDF